MHQRHPWPLRLSWLQPSRPCESAAVYCFAFFCEHHLSLDVAEGSSSDQPGSIEVMVEEETAAAARPVCPRWGEINNRKTVNFVGLYRNYAL